MGSKQTNDWFTSELHSVIFSVIFSLPFSFVLKLPSIDMCKDLYSTIQILDICNNFFLKGNDNLLLRRCERSTKNHFIDILF
jgi:hypothetical protein